MRARSAQKCVPDGEEVRHVILGHRSQWSLLSPGYRLSFNRWIVVTNRSILELSRRWMIWRRRVVCTLPRRTKLGPSNGRWTLIRLDEDSLWVRGKYNEDLSAADSLMRYEWDSPKPFPPTHLRGGGWAWFYLLMAIFFGLIGLADAAFGGTDQARFLGVAIMLAGGMFLATAWSLTQESSRPTWGRTLMVPASITLVLLCVALFLAQAKGPYPWLKWIWMTVGALAVLALFCRPMGDSPVAASDPTGKKTSPRASLLTSIGLTIGSLLTAAQFGYDNAYAPTKTVSALSITAEVKDAPLATNQAVRPDSTTALAMRSVPVAFTFKNTKGARVKTVSSLYYVEGRRATVSQDNGTNFASKVQAGDANFDRPRSRFVSYGRVDVLEIGKALPDDYQFESEEEYHSTVSVILPVDKLNDYQTIRIGVQVVTASASRLNIDFSSTPYRPEPQRTTTHDPIGHVWYTVEEWPLKRLSLVRLMAKGPEVVNVVKFLQYEPDDPATPTPSPSVSGCAHEKEIPAPTYLENGDSQDPCPTAYRYSYDYYGLATAETVIDVPVASPPGATPGALSSRSPASGSSTTAATTAPTKTGG